jgi:hypothetical protein
MFKTKFSFLPKTKLGKLSVIFILIFFAMLLLMQLFVMLGETGRETFTDNLKLFFTATIGGLSGIASFLTGIVSIIKNKERSFLVFLGTLIGLFILFFLLGEFLGPPH